MCYNHSPTKKAFSFLQQIPEILTRLQIPQALNTLYVKPTSMELPYGSPATTHQRKRAKMQQSAAVREQNGKNKARYQDFN